MLTELSPITERVWCHTAIAIRTLFPAPNQPANEVHPRPQFFTAVALLLNHNRASLSHVLHCLAEPFSKLATTWTGAAFDAAMTTASANDPPRHAPSAAAFKIDLAPRDLALEAQLGAPAPVQLLLAVLRAASWPTCATLIDYFAECKVAAVAAHRAIALALLDRVQKGIAEQHARLFAQGAMGPCLLDAAELPQAEPFGDEVLAISEARPPFCMHVSAADVARLLSCARRSA